MSLPDEILSKVFLHAVYNISDSYVMDVALRRIMSIYQRLHTLLAVCTTWRRVGIACPALWTVIPFSDRVKGPPRLLSAPLSLERAGNRDLHLAISAWRFSSKRFKALADQWHRFSVVNLWSNAEEEKEIHYVLSAILKHSAPGSISTLSIRREPTIADVFGQQYHLTHYEPAASRFLSSLAILRTNNFNLEWSRITFTPRLIVLELTNMKLYDSQAITSFFTALSSAQELKELKLVSFVIALDQDDVTKPSAISLPKLKLIHLEHLYFNILQFVLSAIAPGSYCLSLNPLEETFFDYVSGGEGDRVSEDRICAYLSGIKVHKLILWGQRRFFWSSRVGLARLLGSLPTVKTLIMNYYPTNLETLAALKRPPAKPKNQTPFPILTRLEMHGAFVEVPLAQLKTVLKDVLESHQIERMVFGGEFVVDQRMPVVTKPLDENDGVFEWLKAKVPHFTKSPEPSRAPEATDMWRLWDI
ncbi:unnamed protein product [Rhizoctonia solani]|nr:unnamed protein product [Rhizoctonia solani]